MSSNSGYEENCLGSTIINDNVWHNICITYKNGVLKHFIDGALDTLIISNGSSLVINSANETIIGVGVFNSDYFDGFIDEFQIWEVELEQQEIIEYSSCFPSGTENDLRFYLKFEEGSGSLYEQTQNGLNLNSLHGATWNTDSPTQSCHLTNINGCDSVAVLNLTINQPDTAFTNITVCDSYDWDGTTYTQSGSYTNLILMLTVVIAYTYLI